MNNNLTLRFPLEPGETPLSIRLGPDMDPVCVPPPFTTALVSGSSPEIVSAFGHAGDPLDLPQFVEFLLHFEADRRPYVVFTEPDVENYASGTGSWFDGTTRLFRPVKQGVIVCPYPAWTELLAGLWTRASGLGGGIASAPSQATINRAVVEFFEAPRPMKEMAAAWAARKGIS